MLLNVRIIATTDQALDARAQGGLFNKELLEKLNVFRLEMPPLKKRDDEFEDIALGIVSEITRELHKEHIRQLDQAAWDRIRAYDWPGNIRELRNVLRVAIIACQQGQITEADLPDFGHDKVDFHATREMFEKSYLLEILKTFNWDIDQTCRMSKMDKTTLLNKIQKYGLSAQ
jgi:two-component system response regulator HydG